MKAKFCLPIIKTNKQDVLKTINKNMGKYDMFEVWISKISDLDDTFIKDLVHGLSNKVIFVLRDTDGKISLSSEKRIHIISLCKNTQTFIDLDIEKQKDDLLYIKDNKLQCKIITSFHDFKKTPRTSFLVRIISEMSLFNPTIFKIATFCNAEKDALSLLHLLLNIKEQGKKAIILGMGEKGRVTRVFGSLMGNEIIFAPESLDESSAPGQLTKTQLENIFAMMNK